MVVKVRALSANDPDAVASIYTETASLHAALNPFIYHSPDPAALARRYAEKAVKPAKSSATLVAELDGEVVGFVDVQLEDPHRQPSMERPRKAVFVDQIAVAAAHRRTGIGRALLDAVEMWAQERQAEFIYLAVSVGNREAADFYRNSADYESNAEIFVKRLQTD